MLRETLLQNKTMTTRPETTSVLTSVLGLSTPLLTSQHAASCRASFLSTQLRERLCSSEMLFKKLAKSRVECIFRLKGMAYSMETSISKDLFEIP